MKKSVNQPKVSNSEAAPTAELTERLLQRHNKPIGLVDTKHAERVYDRTAGWVSRRLPLLDHWSSRYGSEETGRSGDGQFVFAVTPDQSSHATASDATFAHSVHSSDASVARSTVQTSSAVSSPSRPELYRVRRHVAPPTSAPVATDSPGGHTNPELRSESSGVADKDLVERTRSLPDRGDSLGAAQPMIMRQKLQPPAGPILTNDINRSPDSGMVDSATVVVKSTTPASRVGANSLSSSDDTFILAGPTTSPGLSPMPLAKSESRQTSEGPTRDISRDTASPVARRTRVEEIRPSPAKAESPAAPPLLNSARASQHIQRQPIQGVERIGHQTDSPPPGSRLPPVADQASYRGATEAPVHRGAQPRILTSEVDVTSSFNPKPTMVWRKIADGSPASDGRPREFSGNENVTLPLNVDRLVGASEGVVARQTADATPESFTDTETSTSPVGASPESTQTRATEFDLAQLAEAVGRLLSRQLAVERERRGMKGWN